MIPKDSYSTIIKCPLCRRIGLSCWSVWVKPTAPSANKRQLDSLTEGFKKVVARNEPENVLIVCANCNVGVV